MNEYKNSKKKCSVQQENCKTNNVQEGSLKQSMKVDIGNNSPQHSYDSRVCGYNTPNEKKDYVIYDVEDSPELYYRCSPTSIPCTQDGGNEIAWDWQTSNTKSSCDKQTPSNSLIETPKRTKQLQKKRNSNSPLLQKPLKRKQMKMENIENIGKLTAELKALSEKMKSMQQNCDNHNIENEDNTNFETSSTLVIELDSNSSDDMIMDCKPKMDSIAINSNNKNPASYADLFDDSIDDSMVKCSQEIEQKLNLGKDKKNKIIELSTINEKKELSSTPEKKTYCLITSNTSSECSESFNISRTSLASTNGHLKTYSNNSSKTNATINISTFNSKNIRNNVKNVSHGKQTLQDKSMSDFPDDSFDDCLATCIEDDKLLSRLSEYDFNPSNSGHNTNHSKKAFKLISNPIINKKMPSNFGTKLVTPSKSKLFTDDLVDEVETITDEKVIQNSFPSKNSLENRKFFKTKCLSDLCSYQNKNASKVRSYSTSSVSTSSSIVKGQNPYKNNNIPSINGMENAHELNRLNEKEGGNCIVKYKSTSNLSSMKESQPVRCTPEEIERKRLEAKMRLEAKRKLRHTNRRSIGTISENPEEKSVKR
ncbi:uncharacterized protein LOC100643762 [Bombus terrestris]|uniref:Uncharacterized protein LOC100643762 n=1 Tax=Bombus terrestris TaxID=30195 RepID=A0A9B2JN85_BOMTE|nr:uncharacterized protein LOC100643762 [Bombus terrestris]